MKLYHKPSGVILLVLFSFSCAHRENQTSIEKLLSTPAIEPGKPVLFLVLYPDDCLNCFGNVERHLNYLASEENFPQSNLFIVIPDMRKKVKDNFFKNIIPFDTLQHRIIESSSLADELSKKLPSEKSRSSLLSVYSRGKQFIRAQNLKMISSQAELLIMIK